MKTLTTPDLWWSRSRLRGVLVEGQHFARAAGDLEEIKENCND